jgi:hypothetical protein
MKLQRVVIYFRGHTNAVEYLSDLANNQPEGFHKARVLAPRYSGEDMAGRTKAFLLGLLGIAAVGIIGGLFLYR